MFANRLLSLALMVCLPSSLLAQSEIPNAVQSFVSSHCADCHTGDEAEGGFDIASLSADIAAKGQVHLWTRVIDRVHDGEMPPKDARQFEPGQVSAFTTSASEWLASEQQQDRAARGRVRGRRLTNLQIERSLHDLLGVDIPLADKLPEEPRTDGFTTVASGQPMSHFQLQRHLATVDRALDEAFRRSLTPADLSPRELTARQLCRRRLQSRTREPELMDDTAVTWNSSLIFYGRLPVTTARQAGWYRLTVTASALNIPLSGGVWCSVRTGRCISSSPLLSWAGAFEASAKPKQRTFEAWLEPGDMFELRPNDRTMKQARFAGGQVGTGEGGPQKVPGLALHKATLQRIHYGPDRDTSYKLLFGETKVNVKQGDWRAAKTWFKQPEQVLARLITRFAVRAFRRPVEPDQIAPYIELAQQHLDESESFVLALRTGYRAVLCSPRFLYFQEKPGRLDAYALASRLSYFLWNTMPDSELRAAAASGKLEQKSQVRDQVERMLKHERGRSFVKDFSHEWLELSQINFTEPDRRLFRDFDIVVQQSMLGETHRYLQAMVDDDLSVARLIDSDFTFLNSRLARYYGIDNVTGDELQQVSLKPEHHRGGVLTQGAVLKVTANGTNTSPVVRGVWMAERLLGEYIPPPPENVPAIEPDIRGAKTIREQLAKHRSDANCASCHRKIDPSGFALENFDPSGKWRSNYLAISKGRRVRGPKIDSSDKLPDGRAFRNLDEFQQLVTSKPKQLAVNVVSHLLTYGTGAPVTFADRADIQQVVKQSQEAGYGMRTLITNVVLSDTFQTK